jgi:hypothetical protein
MIGLNDAELLKLNIGGISFRLRISTIRRRSLLNINARLYRLCQLTADERKKAADAYLPTSDELFFERSPLLFNFIYQYYVNGMVEFDFVRKTFIIFIFLLKNLTVRFLQKINIFLLHFDKNKI